MYIYHYARCFFGLAPPAKISASTYVEQTFFIITDIPCSGPSGSLTFITGSWLGEFNLCHVFWMQQRPNIYKACPFGCFFYVFTVSRTSHPLIPRDIDDRTDPDVGDEKPSHCGSDAQSTNCGNVNKQLSTQDDVIGNVHENTAYTNEDHNSVLCDKELCEGTIKSFCCTRCEMSFTSMEELTSHCEKHKTTAKHHCDVCVKSFKWKCHLIVHLRVHSGKRPFKCDVCDKRFAHQVSLTTHLRIHSGERPFQCDVCDKCFAQNGDLTRHLVTHSGERPFKCDVCDQRFTRKGHLARHLTIHSGERPFKCDVCDKSFTQRCVLTKHLRIHSGERPFKCDVCDKSFTHKYSLTRHLRIHC